MWFVEATWWGEPLHMAIALWGADPEFLGFQLLPFFPYSSCIAFLPGFPGTWAMKWKVATTTAASNFIFLDLGDLMGCKQQHVTRDTRHTLGEKIKWFPWALLRPYPGVVSLVINSLSQVCWHGSGRCVKPPRPCVICNWVHLRLLRFSMIHTCMAAICVCGINENLICPCTRGVSCSNSFGPH